MGDVAWVKLVGWAGFGWGCSGCVGGWVDEWLNGRAGGWVGAGWAGLGGCVSPFVHLLLDGATK